MKKQQIAGIVISLVVALIFIVLHSFTNFLTPTYEFGIDWRFKAMRPYTETTGDHTATVTKTPPKVQQNIKIIGITTDTLNELGEWPLARHYYAKAIEAVTPMDADGKGPRALLVDIMFLTKRKLEAQKILSLAGNKGNKAFKKNIMELYKNDDKVLRDAFTRARNISSDFPFLTDPNAQPVYSNNPKADLKRLETFLQFTIPNENVKDTTNYAPWVSFPFPPITGLMRTGQVPGFANIRASDFTQINRKMPLVVKWSLPNNGGTLYFPNIDLIVVANYYGIDYKKDIEVVMGEYIKLKNIPKASVKGNDLSDRDIMMRPNEDRSITIPIDKEGFMDINYAGGPFSYPTMDLKMLVTGGPGEYAESFEDSILLFAMYYATGASTAHDVHASPFNPEHAGIEHHANAINTILTQDFLTHAPIWMDGIIYASFALVMGLVVPTLSTVLGFLFFVALAVIVNVLSIYTFEYHNIIHVYISVMWMLLLSYIVITVYRIVFEEGNTRYIRQTFSKFVSKDIVNELLQDPDNLKLGGEKKDITVMFSDVRGFTTISEGMSPEDLVALLNDYLSEMSEVILDSKGTIDKYIGDAIMAFWGAPLPMEDHAFQACRACVLQMDLLHRLAPQWEKTYGINIDIGIGLNTGPAVVGNMGSSHRMDYTLMGDTVNLGARLEGSNKMYGTKIIISEFTYAQVQDRVIVRELDKVKVKGKTEPVVIYELVDIEDKYKHPAAES
jgi:adenylate cyclase